MAFPLKDLLGYQLQLFGLDLNRVTFTLLVLPFKARNNFKQLSKNISLYYSYRFSTHEITFFSQFQPQVHF